MQAIQKVWDSIPLWGLFAITVFVVMCSFETGFWVGVRASQRLGQNQRFPIGGIVGALLGLLAFMLTFTFGFAASRFETRRNLVLDEANAIGTTWLRAGFFSEPYRGEIRNLLREYRNHRVMIVQTGTVEQELSQAAEFHRRLWSQAVAAGEKNPGSILAGLFVSSLNDVIDLHAKRVNWGIRNRIPPILWGVLYLLVFLGMSAMGYQAGTSTSRRSFIVLPVVLAFSLVLVLIADLDRPQRGLLKTSQKPLTDLRLE
jgi:hypothetical protein